MSTVWINNGRYWSNVAPVLTSVLLAWQLPLHSIISGQMLCFIKELMFYILIFRGIICDESRVSVIRPD